MPRRLPAPAAPPIRPCKVCGGAAPLYGVVDFNKHCAEGRGVKLPAAGQAVYYRRCAACGFLFSDYFDDWSDAEFLEHIYNPGYAQIDPDYSETRPADNARMVAALFGALKDTLSVLDFGGGNGRFAALLRDDHGFADCTTYEKLNPEFAAPPQRRFALITCFETLEHVPDPVACAGAIAGCLAEEGLVLMSTLLQPAHFDSLGLSWWYVGPRNGHISIHSPRSLPLLWQTQGWRFTSLGRDFHIACRGRLPAFAHDITQRVRPR